MGLASLEAKRKMDLQNIPVPRRPRDDFPALPEDPTELSDSELMTLFTTLTKWSEYLSAQKVMAEVDERYAEAALDKTKLIKGYDFRNKTDKTLAAADQEYWEALEAYQQRMSYRKVIEMTYDNAERNSALLSRELTRRVNRTARDGRSDRWGGA